MRLNGNSGFALALIALGALLLIGSFGFGLGHLLSYLIPIVLIVLGYMGIKNGRSFFGWTFMIIGFLSLLNKFGSLLGFIVAVGIIMYGVSLLKRNPKTN